MRQLTVLPAVVVMSLLVAACGGDSDDTTDPVTPPAGGAEAGEGAGDAGDGSDGGVDDGDGPVPPSDTGDGSGTGDGSDAGDGSDTGDESEGTGSEPINAAEARNRNIVTGVMRSVGTLDYLSGTLAMAAFQTADGDSDCEAGGTAQRSDAGGVRQISFSDCRLTDEAPYTLDGRADVAREGSGSDLGVTFTDLALRTPDQSVVVNGTLEVSFIEVARVTLGTGLSLARGDDLIAIDDLEVSWQPNGFGADATGSRTTVSYRATLTDPDVSISVSTEDALISEQNVTCPVSGSLTIMVNDDQAIQLVGGEGDNLNYTFEEDVQTLACSEVQGGF